MAPSNRRWIARLYPTVPLLAKLRGVLRRPKPGEPPPSLNFVGGAAFTSGHSTLKHLIDVARLTPDDAVLDIGCGIGRIAMPLQGYLSAAGSYDGFDIVKSGIDWCAEHIKHPNFRFAHVDVYNLAYNPTGVVPGDAFVFPYPDESFTFVIANSVFTHMLPADTQRYLTEIARVSKPSLNSYITAFLLTEQTQLREQDGQTAYRFRHRFEGYRTVYKRFGRERVVGYEEQTLLEMAARAGLVIRTIARGSWSTNRARSGDQGRLFQDVIVFGKAGGRAA